MARFSAYVLILTTAIAFISTTSCNSIQNESSKYKLISPTEKKINSVQNSLPVSSTTPVAQFVCKETENKSQFLKSPIVIMLSIDGFRADYLQKYNPPNLTALAKAGIYTAGMRPSFPTHTFPNHYSLATGLVPGHHGIVSNKFYDKARKQTYNFMDPKSSADGSWYLGEPIWNTAERQGMIAHTYHWVGSEAHINNQDPTCYIAYDPDITIDEKVNKAIEWLKLPDQKRPHLINLYVSIVDSAGHKYGPDSNEVKQAIAEVDLAVGKIWQYMKTSQLPTNLIIVSDHGMEKIDNDHLIYLSDYTDMNGFILSDRGAVTMLYHENAEKIEKAYLELKAKENHFKVYRKAETPKEFQLDHPDRIGDIVVIADMPYYILDRSFTPTPLALNSATHGWSFHNQQMKALFIAYGKNIEKNKLIPEFQNIDVYPFIINILGLNLDIKIDGKPETLSPYILRKQNSIH